MGFVLFCCVSSLSKSAADFLFNHFLSFFSAPFRGLFSKSVDGAKVHV